MDLKTYLKSCNLSIRDFAKISGITYTTVYRILKGEKIFKSTAAKLKRKTREEVIYDNLYHPKGCNQLDVDSSR